MRDAFPHPLTEACLSAFTHPDPDHALHSPHRYRSAVLATNGYIAILAHRGLWLDADYPEAPPSLQARADRYDWTTPARIPADQWTNFDRLEATIRKAVPPALWLGLRPAPSPLWQLGPTRIPLSLLGLIMRLPRAELALTGTASTFFRFSGGIGLVPPDPRIATSSPTRLLMQTPDPII
jgi:hypothetical protein